jgi:hypothetical protein
MRFVVAALIAASALISRSVFDTIIAITTLRPFDNARPFKLLRISREYAQVDSV